VHFVQIMIVTLSVTGVYVTSKQRF